MSDFNDLLISLSEELFDGVALGDPVDGIEPTIVVYGHRGDERVTVRMPLRATDEGKVEVTHDSLVEIGRVLYSQGIMAPVMIFLISEAWAKSGDTMKESAIILGRSISGRCNRVIFDITRTEDNEVCLSNARYDFDTYLPGTDFLSGLFAGSLSADVDGQVPN